MKQIAMALLMGGALVLSACARENANEKLADEVTRAVQANDVSPVEKNFNALVRPKMTHASVGRLADQLAPLGKLKRNHEVAANGQPATHHEFNAEFDKGSAHESMDLDADGKIAKWWVTAIAVK